MNPYLPDNLQDADQVIDAEEIDRAVDWYVDKYGEQPPTPMVAFDQYVEWCERNQDEE